MIHIFGANSVRRSHHKINRQAFKAEQRRKTGEEEEGECYARLVRDEKVWATHRKVFDINAIPENMSKSSWKKEQLSKRNILRWWHACEKFPPLLLIIMNDHCARCTPVKILRSFRAAKPPELRVCKHKMTNTFYPPQITPFLRRPGRRLTHSRSVRDRFDCCKVSSLRHKYESQTEIIH